MREPKLKKAIDQYWIDLIKECLPDEDLTPDANEYERADRIAWNQCRTKFIQNLAERGVDIS